MHDTTQLSRWKKSLLMMRGWFESDMRGEGIGSESRYQRRLDYSCHWRSLPTMKMFMNSFLIFVSSRSGRCLRVRCSLPPTTSTHYLNVNFTSKAVDCSNVQSNVFERNRCGESFDWFVLRGTTKAFPKNGKSRLTSFHGDLIKVVVDSHRALACRPLATTPIIKLWNFFSFHKLN